MGITVTPLSDALGAEIHGVDLSRTLDAGTIAAIEDAWHAHIVLVFRDQTLEPDDQIRLCEALGGIAERGLPEKWTPEGERSDRRIALVTNIRENGHKIGQLADGEMWFHHDGCFNDEPYKGTMLYAMEVPSTGGNTLFANMYTAYDKLTDAMKARLKGLETLQIYDYTQIERIDPDDDADLSRYRHARQPITITHPATGRRALFVNPLMTARIEGMDRTESDALLDELFRFVDDSELVFEHVWRKGDMVLLDNWCSCHARTDFPGDQIRLLRRTMVAGQKLAE